MSDALSDAFYRAAVRAHGHGPQAVGWSTACAQRSRFRIIDEALDLHGARLLDVGCGLGAMYEYLREHGRAVEYVGIDPVPEMIARARERLPDAEFHELSLEQAREDARIEFGSFDFVVASGIFSRRGRCSPARVAFAARLMFEACREAAMFNSLSARIARNRGRGFRVDPAEVCALLLDITPHLAMRHDPGIGDVAFTLRRAG